MNDSGDVQPKEQAKPGTNSCCCGSGGCCPSGSSGGAKRPGLAGWRTVVFVILALLVTFIIVQAFVARRVSSPEPDTVAVEASDTCRESPE